MQLQPKAIDGSQNVLDIRKARNANELITVIGRINTALRLQQSQHSTEPKKVKFSSLSKLYAGLSWVLQTQAELQAAALAAQHLDDGKRERCLAPIARLNDDVLVLKRDLITRINNASKKLASATLHRYANEVHDFLRPLSEKLYSISMYDEPDMYIAFVARNVTGTDGFVSPEVCIKLRESAGAFYVSLPYSPFVEAAQVPIASIRDLQAVLTSSLNLQRKPAAKPKEDRLLRIEGVTRVDVTDTLNLYLDSAVRPTDINAILQIVLPLIKRTFERGEFEVLHRFKNTPEERCLQLCVGQRHVLDPRMLTRLTRMLGMSKPQITQLTSLLETP